MIGKRVVLAAMLGENGRLGVTVGVPAPGRTRKDIRTFQGVRPSSPHDMKEPRNRLDSLTTHGSKKNSPTLVWLL